MPERGVWRKGTGKRRLKKGCQKEGFGGRVPESEDWRKGARKKGLAEGCGKRGV